VSLRSRILEYLRKYPSVGVLRLALDLAPSELLPGGGEWERHVGEVEKTVKELAGLGLVEYKDDIGVVNYKPFREAGWAFAGGNPPWIPRGEPAAVGANVGATPAAAGARKRRSPKRRNAALDNFLGGNGGG
jgi:hypothetical protein